MKASTLCVIGAIVVACFGPASLAPLFLLGAYLVD